MSKGPPLHGLLRGRARAGSKTSPFDSSNSAGKLGNFFGLENRLAGTTATHTPLCSLSGRRGHFRMDRSDRYRRFAKECLELARTATDERSKATFLQMAQVWNRLADQQDRKVNGEVAH